MSLNSHEQDLVVQNFFEKMNVYEIYTFWLFS